MAVPLASPEEDEEGEEGEPKLVENKDDVTGRSAEGEPEESRGSLGRRLALDKALRSRSTHRIRAPTATSARDQKLRCMPMRKGMGAFKMYTKEVGSMGTNTFSQRNGNKRDRRASATGVNRERLAVKSRTLFSASKCSNTVTTLYISRQRNRGAKEASASGKNIEGGRVKRTSSKPRVYCSDCPPGGGSSNADKRWEK